MEQNLLTIKCNKQGCGKTFLKPYPEKAGLYTLTCPHCKQKMLKKLPGKPTQQQEKEKEAEPKPTEPTQKTEALGKNSLGMGKLTLARLHGLMGRKSFSLNFGDNVVGRKDADLHSNIEVDDPFMSRRSINIVVTQTDTGCLFKLQVISATNPVFRNGKRLMVGEALYLNYGDVIKLGRTTFNFEKA